MKEFKGWMIEYSMQISVKAGRLPIFTLMISGVFELMSEYAAVWPS
jgi:hypothetical protein